MATNSGNRTSAEPLMSTQNYGSSNNKTGMSSYFHPYNYRFIHKSSLLVTHVSQHTCMSYSLNIVLATYISYPLGEIRPQLKDLDKVL